MRRITCSLDVRGSFIIFFVRQVFLLFFSVGTQNNVLFFIFYVLPKNERTDATGDSEKLFLGGF